MVLDLQLSKIAKIVRRSVVSLWEKQHTALFGANSTRRKRGLYYRNSRGLLILLLLTAGLAVGAVAHDLPKMTRGVNTFPWVYRARALNDDGIHFLYGNLFPNLVQYRVEDFKALRAMGFDFVRVPVEPGPFLSADPEQLTVLTKNVLDQTRKAADAGLSVIIDLHPREGRPNWTSEAILSQQTAKRQYVHVLTTLATAMAEPKFSNYTLELMNEPPGGWGYSDSARWAGFQQEIVTEVRRVAPQLTLIATGDRGGGVDGLVRLNPTPIDDPNIIYSFHYYDPMVVTHQGASFTSVPWRQYLKDVPYPPIASQRNALLAEITDNIDRGVNDPTLIGTYILEASSALTTYFSSNHGEETISSDFDKVSNWAKHYNIPTQRIFLGEFGIFRPGASDDTAINYMRDVRSAAEKHSFRWAFWNYTPADRTVPAFSFLKMGPQATFAPDDQILSLGLGMLTPQR